VKPINDTPDRLPLRCLRQDDPANFHELAEYELPEWLAAEQEALREREAIDRAKIGIAVLVVLLSGLIAITAVANYAGAA
jgi:hypothetical protein